MRPKMVACVRACVDGTGSEYEQGREHRNTAEVEQATRKATLEYSNKQPLRKMRTVWESNKHALRMSEHNSV